MEQVGGGEGMSEPKVEDRGSVNAPPFDPAADRMRLFAQQVVEQSEAGLKARQFRQTPTDADRIERTVGRLPRRDEPTTRPSPVLAETPVGCRDEPVDLGAELLADGLGRLHDRRLYDRRALQKPFPSTEEVYDDDVPLRRREPTLPELRRRAEPPEAVDAPEIQIETAREKQ
jgi:hypothetical protein